MVPNAQKLGGSILELQGTLLNYAEIPLDAKLDHMTIEELLEVTGGHVVHCGPFNTLCEEANIYQFWTKEYVEHLSEYLLKRCKSNRLEDQGKERRTLIVDVGAGDGLLIQFIQEYMEQRIEKKSHLSKTQQKRYPDSIPTLIATDDGSWGIFAKANVDKMSVEDAIHTYCSTNNINKADGDKYYDEIIVLCSWMPMGQDWSQMFRNANVDEYILIGEADDGTCGHNWETWGNPNFFFNDDEEEEEKDAFSGEKKDSARKEEKDDDTSNDDTPLLLPPYAQDGYERWDMDVLTQFQFSRFDCAVSRSSKTVSFRKQPYPKGKAHQTILP